MPRADVLLVSLGSTPGLRRVDADLVGALRRAGASVVAVQAVAPRRLRTLALTEAAWALAARRAAAGGHAAAARTVIYGTTTAALLWPRPGAIRFDAPAAGNRPGRHGVWQRAAEARRFAAAPLLVPQSEAALAEAPRPHAPAVVVPVPVAPSGPAAGARDVAAVTYGANPRKKGLDRVLDAWATARRGDEVLVVAGVSAGEVARAIGGARAQRPGVRFGGHLGEPEYRALLRRARVFVTAPRREDHGVAQLEALADGCALVTTAAPGPYVALPLARALDSRLVGPNLASAIRTALDDPAPGYAEGARALLAPLAPAAVDRVVAERLLPALLNA